MRHAPINPPRLTRHGEFGVSGPGCPGCPVDLGDGARYHEKGQVA